MKLEDGSVVPHLGHNVWPSAARIDSVGLAAVPVGLVPLVLPLMRQPVELCTQLARRPELDG